MEYQVHLKSNNRQEKIFSVCSSNIEVLRIKLRWFMKNEGFKLADAWDEDGNEIIIRMRAQSRVRKPFKKSKKYEIL